jgi:tRNA nucleotidyltransferase (CCA-adding enzyme)
VAVDIVPCVESQENEDSKARKTQVDRERYKNFVKGEKG